MRAMRRGDRYYETTRTVWGLRRLATRFALHDYTAKVGRDPARFEATDVVTPGTFRQRFALFALGAAYWLAPAYIWVLEKTAPGDPRPTVAPTPHSSAGPRG